MKKNASLSAIVTVGVLLVASPLFGHHGSGISYDMQHPWTTKAVITEFRYQNPHPTVLLDRVNDKGETEHWVTEIATNPSFMIRAGWTKKRSEDALKPGTPVTVTICTSKAGGQSGILTKILNEKGEEVVTSREGENPLRQNVGGGAGRTAGGQNPPQ